MSQPTIYGAAYRTPPLRQGSPETHFLQVCHALIARYPGYRIQQYFEDILQNVFFRGNSLRPPGNHFYMH